MALPPLELFSLKRKPPCCRAAFSSLESALFPALRGGVADRERVGWVRFTQPRHAVTISTGDADVAQLVEQLIRNQQVVRSIRIVGSNPYLAAFIPYSELVPTYPPLFGRTRLQRSSPLRIIALEQ